MEEGYIKYQLYWTEAPALPEEAVQELSLCREQLYHQGLIGFDAKLKVGYGNISRRCEAHEAGLFLISGTQTGAFSPLGARHFCTVTDYSLPQNQLYCTGPIRASSESLTHAAVYALADRWQAVIHVHHRAHWERLCGRIPTTSAEVPYGTPEMAYEIARLYGETPLPTLQVLAMGGHEEGLISFGTDLADAYTRLMSVLDS